MKKLFIFLLIIGCNPYRQGPADMQYLIHDDKPGPAIQYGDFLFVHFIHRTESDSLLSSSYLSDHPVFFTQQKPFFKGDIFTGLALLSEGDSATFKLNFDSMQVILDVPKPPHLKDKYLLFTVKVIKVIPAANKTEIQDFREANALQRQLQEAEKIQRYISSRHLLMSRTKSGLYYTVTKKGDPNLPVKGFMYTARHITGRIFDSNIADTAKRAGLFDERRNYTLSTDSITIPGVDEALRLFPAGTKVTLVIPSALAYGARGNTVFLPYTPLVFELEIN